MASTSDEVQELPSLFPALRVLADRDPGSARFVITGSVSPNIIRGISLYVAAIFSHRTLLIES